MYVDVSRATRRYPLLSFVVHSVVFGAGAGYLGYLSWTFHLEGEVFGAWLMGILSFCLGLGVVGSVVQLVRARRPRSRQSTAPPAVRRVVVSKKRAVRKAWTRAVLLSALVLPMTTWITYEIVRTGEAIGVLPVMAMFFVIMLILIRQAVRLQRQHARFGETVFELDERRAAPGGVLRGEVVTGLRPRDVPDQGIEAWLSCYRLIVSDSGNNRDVDRQLIWRDEKWLEGLPTGKGVRIPFSFALPPDARRSQGNIVWRLELKADVPGPKFDKWAQVRIKAAPDPSVLVDDDPLPSALVSGGLAGAPASAPVAEIGGGNGAPVAAPPAVAGRVAAPAIPYPRSRGIAMKESGDAVTFTFGAARDRKTALGLTACFLFMLPFAGVFILYDGELPFWVAFWLLVFVVVLGGLSFVTWTYASRITVGGGTLRYVRGPFGKGSERCLFAPDIVGLEVGMDGEVLGKARYKIIARLRDARPMKLAGGLQDRREAAWIADRLNRALVQDEVRFG